MLSGKILIQGMLFYAYHGRHEVERELGQKFLVDVEATLNLKEGVESDDPKSSVDTVDIYNLVKKIVFESKYRLEEALAARIAREILNKFQRVDSVKVRIKKPSLTVSGIVEYAGVEVELDRSSYKT